MNEPLGLTLVPGGANVAVFSAHATAIELCLFDAAGNTERSRIALPERSGDVFHGFVAGIRKGQRYGLRATGPYDPRNGHRFNPHKLLVDPYATVLDRPFVLHESQFGEEPDGKTCSERDSAPFVPKAIAVPASAKAPARGSGIPWSDTIVYELHVRGYTKTHPEVPEAMRGTCAGLAHPAAIAHLQRLGVTTVELMPVASWVDERHLGPLGLTNYWGYNPVALMAPDPRLAPGGMAELAACVAALHEAGIEVLLDVVLNHTGEGDELGPTLSLRGLDNATYYRTLPGDHARYANDAGCGNTLALDRAPVLRLAMDTLRHYARAAGVDGFRFDLATTVARRDHGFDPAAPLLQAIEQDPMLRALKLVAEPWDLGPGGHRLGAFPAGWGEWNDRYRDTVRRYWRGDAGMTGEVATRIAGSGDIFAHRSRQPSRSVNFVCAHDGFTLADLVSWTHKRNEANGENNRDGTDANLSWNHGIEGATNDDAVAAARKRDVRSLLATLFVSRGTPMLAMGDELGRSQQGNNNAYAQDNALAWVDWSRADGELAGFVAALGTLRHAHRALRDDRWLWGEPVDASGIPDVEWRHPDGRAMSAPDWEHPQGRVLIAALYAPGNDGTASDRVVIALNAGTEAVTVRWPDARDGQRWRLAIDTALTGGRPSSAHAHAPDTLAPRAVVVLVEEPAAAGAKRRAGMEPAVLEQLTRAAGIAPTWHDVSGKEYRVTDDARLALLEAMGLAARTTGQARERLAALAAARELRLLPRARVLAEGHGLHIPVVTGRGSPGLRALRLVGEDGRVQRVACDLAQCASDRIRAADGRLVERRLVTLPALPVGHYGVSLEDASETCHLLVVPRRCYLPESLRDGQRRFGLAAHLYALRREGDQGSGDFTTLAQAGAATARVGGALVGIQPLHALFPAQRERASPYHPSDRRFLDALYIDVQAVPDFAASEAARRALEQQEDLLRRLAQSPAVDYAGAWSAKRAVLDACYDAFVRRTADDPLVREFGEFVTASGERLRRFAAFEAISATRPGVPWQRWAEELRRPDDPGVARFAARHAREVHFAMYLQWLADRQLAQAAQAGGLEIGFYRDLAIGAAPDGAEAWSMQAALGRGVSIGAPPDPLGPEGQIWNLPPPLPDALDAGGYEGFRALIAANARHAGALRIDHVMGLARLFWVPDGATATEGAYVRYPFDDLLGALALESARARCLIVGEDLGTVEEGLRERLSAADVLSYRVLWFERDGPHFRAPQRYPVKAAACISTHDLPTIRGWRHGVDIEERRSLGLANDEETATARMARAEDVDELAGALQAAGVSGDPGGAAADDAWAQSLHRYIGATPCALALVQADDLAGESEPLNLPGTDRERPNWRRRVAVNAEQLWNTPIGEQAARDLAQGRGTQS